MKEYIEREAVLERLAKVDMDTYYGFTAAVQFGVNHAIQCIKEAPAADVVEVRHGRWIGIEYDGYADGFPVYDLWECSECGEEVRGEDVPSTHPWCHSCGARMGKEDWHETS